MPQLRTAFEVCAGAGSHLEHGFARALAVPPSKACPSICRICSYLRIQKGINHFHYKTSHCFGNVTYDGWLPLFLNERVYQDWKSLKKHGKPFKGLETHFALLIFVI